MEKSGSTVEYLKLYKPEKYFQDILEVKEFEGLKTLVDDSDGAIGWEELVREGVVKIGGMKVKGIYWSGTLLLTGTSIKSLRKFKKVGGDLVCNELVNLRDIGELEEVGGYCSLEDTSIDSLGNLKRVGGSCFLDNTKIKSLGKLKIIKGALTCMNIKTLEDLGELEEVYGNCSLSGTRLRTLGNLREVGGSLFCEGIGTLEDLGELEEVGNICMLNGTSIKTLGNLKKVGYILGCSGIKTLEDIGNLETVDKLALVGTNIKLQIELINLWRKGEFKAKKEMYFGGNIKGIEELLNQKMIPGILELEDCNVSIQMEALYRYQTGKLSFFKIQVSEFIKEQMSKLYQNNRLNLKAFEKLYGDDINEIEDIELRQYAKKMLIREYNIIREELKGKVDKIKKNNEGKELSNEEKKDLRKRVIELGNKLEEKKEKIESFGIKLEYL